MTSQEKFEAWYVEHAFDLKACPIGSRECGLQRIAWESSRKQALQDAAAEAHAWGEQCKGELIAEAICNLDNPDGEPS